MLIFGGYGYCHEYDVERVFRDGCLAPIGGGTSDVQKVIISLSHVRIRLVNFDWTEKDKEFKSRVAGLFGQAGRTSAESLEHVEPPELERLTREYLGKLAEVGYLERRHRACGRIADNGTYGWPGRVGPGIEFTFPCGRDICPAFRRIGLAGFGEAAHMQEILEPLRLAN